MAHVQDDAVPLDLAQRGKAAVAAARLFCVRAPVAAQRQRIRMQCITASKMALSAEFWAVTAASLHAMLMSQKGWKTLSELISSILRHPVPIHQGWYEEKCEGISIQRAW